MKKLTAAAAFMMVMGMCVSASANYDENLNSYTLDTIIVEAEATKNKFGDTITEQSYYRTGGDVKVITREEIEKRHYTDISEAIKRVPGVHFQNPGYRGGEYGYAAYNNGVSINGDTRVIVLIDGRRVDNSASERISSSGRTGSKSTGVNIDQVTNMENVEKIEVIKGPGASQYGSDATGGVINIITRKGGKEGKGSIDLSTGSWHKHKYAISYSGSTEKDNSLRYFISANRDMSQDTKFKDGITGQTGTLGGSKWKEDGANIRIDKEFNEKQNLKFWYNYKQGKDGYPITVPALKYQNEEYWKGLMFRQVVAAEFDETALASGLYKIKDGSVGRGWSSVDPAYRNLFTIDGGIFGSFSKFKTNDLDIQYTFDKENGMESFIRFYDQNHKYSNRDKYVWGVNPDGTTSNGASSKLNAYYKELYPDGATAEQLEAFIDNNLAPFPGGDKDKIKRFLELTGGSAAEPTSWHEERNRGFQLQYAKNIGVNDIIINVGYDKAKHFNSSVNAVTGVKTSTHTDRSTTSAYIQDKIHVSDKWDITPSLRYAHYSSWSSTNARNEATNGKGSTHLITPSVQSQYMFDDTASMYFGWTKVFRPLRRGDYNNPDQVAGGMLQDEKGDAWTIGFRKEFSKDSSFAIHYDWTRMSNSIARLPIYDLVSEETKNYYVNAKEDKKSFNMTYDQKIGKHVNMSLSYSHMKDKWMAKNGWVLSPDYVSLAGADINVAINRLRPANHYALNLSYENGKLYTGLLTNLYTGCSNYAFTNNRFLVLDWNINYKVNDDLTIYAICSNLTNEAYETSYSAGYGPGGAAMPGRCWMIGAKYTF